MSDDDLLTRLRTAAVDPDPVPVGAAIDASRQRRLRHRVGGSIAVVVAALAVVLPLTLTGGGHARVVITRPEPAPAPHTSQAGPSGPVPGVTAKITVDHATLPAGGTFHFRVTVNNGTGKPLGSWCSTQIPCQTSILYLAQVFPPAPWPEGWTWAQACQPRCLTADEPLPAGTTTTELTIATSKTPATIRLFLDRYLNLGLPIVPAVTVTTTPSAQKAAAPLPNPFLTPPANENDLQANRAKLIAQGLAPIVEQRFDVGGLTGESVATKPDIGSGVPAGSTVVIYDYVPRPTTSTTKP